MASSVRVSIEQARNAWFTAQGLAGSRATSPSAVVERTGFIRSLGGVDVYLALLARLPDLARADLDAQVEKMDLQVVPAVRGCMYLVPRRDVPWALRLADSLSSRRISRERERAGLRTGEVEEVGTAVLSVLSEQGPSTTAQLRRLLPDGLLHSLGAAGKKVGLSSALPPALRDLEFQGQIERHLDGGKLDTERYLWRVTAKNPFEGASVPDQLTAIHIRMADRFLRAAGIGSLGVFAAWSGLGKRAARNAFEELDLIEVEVRGLEGSRFALSEYGDSLCAQEAALGVALLPFEDNLIAMQGGPADLVDAVHHDLRVPVWGSSRNTTTLGKANHMSNRSIVIDGRIVGLWEYDPDGHRVVWKGLDTLSAPVESRIRAAADEVSRFLADELGHGRSFSIDSDDALRKRCGDLRSLE